MTPMELFLLGPFTGAQAENSSYSDCDIKIKEAVQRIFQNPELNQIVKEGYVRLLEAQILGQDEHLDFLRAAFLSYPEYADLLASAAHILHKNGLLTAANKEALMQHPQYSYHLASGIATLHDDENLTDDNRLILLQRPEHAKSIAEAIGLILVNLESLTDEIINSFLDFPAHCFSLARAIVKLYPNEILTPDYIKILRENSMYSERLATGFEILVQNNLLREPHTAHLLQYPESAEELAKGLATLHNANLLTEDNLNKLLEEPHRALEIADEIARAAQENEFVDLYVTGENVHSRDQKIRTEIVKLRKSQGSIASQIQAFKNFILKQKPSPKIEAALYAMEGEPKPGEDFPALIGLQDPWAIAGLQIVGEELLSRLWLFTTEIKDAQNRENARLSMISALADSFDEHGFRVCNPGKAGRLVTGVLQGNVPGLVFDEVDYPNPITPEPALGIFFLLPEHKEIDNLADLLSRANKWLAENPLVTDRQGFLTLLEEYANYQELPKEKIA